MYFPRWQVHLTGASELTVVSPSLPLKVVAAMRAPSLFVSCEEYSIAPAPFSALLRSKMESLMPRLWESEAKSPPPLLPATQPVTATACRSRRLPRLEAMPPPSLPAEELLMVMPRRTASPPSSARTEPPSSSSWPLMSVMSCSSNRQPPETRKCRERPSASMVALASGLLRIEIAMICDAFRFVHSSSLPPSDRKAPRWSWREVSDAAVTTSARSSSTLSTSRCEGRSGGSGGGEGGDGGLGGGDGGDGGGGDGGRGVNCEKETSSSAMSDLAFFPTSAGPVRPLKRTCVVEAGRMTDASSQLLPWLPFLLQSVDQPASL
mmetsp:Transcript_38312/g.124619  ORF Transcript_38312/g.124619 Transcript_38312/m.124619 type:complete len:321 (+) Transcript_38312:336-1298(+)